MRIFAQRLIGLAVLGVGAVLTAYGQAGTIQGKVTDPQGKALSGVMVSAVTRTVTSAVTTATATVPQAPPPPGQPTKSSPPVFMPVQPKAASGADGSFEIDNLPAGSYYLCARKGDSDLLDPCLWTDAQKTVSAPATGVSLVVAHGVTIALRVHDANGLTALRPAADDILIGTVHGSSPFIPARVIQRDGTGKTLGLTVPPAAALNLMVRSRNFALNNDSGAALAPGTVIPLTAPLVSSAAGANGIPVPVLTVHVSGAAVAQ